VAGKVRVTGLGAMRPSIGSTGRTLAGRIGADVSDLAHAGILDADR
jgi:hypothetical protein